MREGSRQRDFASSTLDICRERVACILCLELKSDETGQRDEVKGSFARLRKLHASFLASLPSHFTANLSLQSTLVRAGR